VTAIVELLRGLLALAGLLLPGAGWAFAARWPRPWLMGGLLSALIILVGVLVLSALEVRIALPTLGGWLLACGGPGWIGWLRRERKPADAAAGLRESWLALPALLLVLVATWRAVAQPLSGVDVGFRWNLLAHLLIEHGSLAGYPPLTTPDFQQYFWADGISPLTSSLYAWTYLAGGSFAQTWTAIPVLLQVAGLLALLHAFANESGGPRAGWFACALGAGTMLLQFAFNLGQETGLTTLGAGTMVFCLSRWHRTGESRLLVPAALAAAVAGCAREYGLVAPVMGAIWMFAGRKNGRLALAFFAGAALLPIWWHTRVFLLTGNPLYAQEFAGFPTNPVFAAWMRMYREVYGDQLRHGASWLEIARILAVTALPAWAALLASLFRRRTVPVWGLGWLIVLGFGAAWLASVPFTAGGLFYSMRVLGPVVLVGCAWGGALLAHAVPARRHLAGVWLALLLFAGDASLRALTIPSNPYTLSPRDWPMAGYQLQQEFDRENDAFLRQVARVATGRVLSDSAGLREFFRREGRSYSPFWSPDVAWLFRGEPAPAAAARLRALGFSHVLVKRSPLTVDFLQRTGALRALEGKLRVVLANDTFLLLELAPGTAGP